MEQLTKIDNAITAPTSADLQRIRQDRQTFPRLREVPEMDALVFLAKLVTKAMLYRGQKADETFVRFTASALRGELLADTARCGLDEITLQEIAYVVRRAVLSQEMYGVNVSSLYMALVNYARKEGAGYEKKTQATADQLAAMKAAYAIQMNKNTTTR